MKARVRWEKSLCEEIEKRLDAAANLINWSNHDRNWRNEIVSNTPLEVDKYNDPMFEKFPILNLMNFIYLIDRHRTNLQQRPSNLTESDRDVLKAIGDNFEKFSIWCSHTFPKLIPLIKNTIPDFIKKFDTTNYRLDFFSNFIFSNFFQHFLLQNFYFSDRKEFETVKKLMKQIDALSQFNVTLISRYELDKNPSDITERKSAERVNLKRADFICLIRLKFDEDLEPRIMNKWAELQSSPEASVYKNWQAKLSESDNIRTLKTLAMGYKDSIKGRESF